MVQLQDNLREQVLGTWVGTIKSYNHEKKFGFISCPELNAQSGVTGDVYLHDKAMQGFAVGNSVSFTACLRDGRLQGRDLQHKGKDPQHKGDQVATGGSRAETCSTRGRT